MYYEKNVMFADAGTAGEYDILTPDIMTPSQHLDTLRASHLDPVRMFMLAVLEEGINDYRNTRPRGEPDLRSNKARRLHEDTRLWILGAEAHVTFRDCCEALGIDTEWLRKGVLASPMTAKLKRRHMVQANRVKVAITREPSPESIDVDMLRRVAEMHRNGASIHEMTAASGKSVRTIRRWLSLPVSRLNEQNI